MGESNSLQALMQERLPEGGVMVVGGSDPHIEVVEVETGHVWMSVEPATQRDYDLLVKSLDDSMQPMGIGKASMDAASFSCSPGNPGLPVQERTVNGRRYINVAIPGERRRLPCGMMEVLVDKAHVLGFEAGRRLTILSLPEGDFVEVVGSGENDHKLAFPEGSRLKQITLDQPWIVALPTPTKTLWHFDFGLRSFQGPVALP